MWIRHDGAVAAVIDRKIFDKAQELRKRRQMPLTDQEGAIALLYFSVAKVCSRRRWRNIKMGVPFGSVFIQTVWISKRCL